MADPSIVLLTGSKNNAGDFLIKHRAMALLHHFKPDFQLIDYNAWEPIDNNKLNIINKSRCLLLTGGPALQENMYPRVYRLLRDLDSIEVPIVTMGIGWYAADATWYHVHRYPLSKTTLSLLERIDSSGYYSSVRDYHTLRVLHRYGFKNYVVTGCPALFDLDHLVDSSVPLPHPPSNIGFSLGVSLKDSLRMYKQMQEVLLGTRRLFPNANLVVAFHHDSAMSEGPSPSVPKILAKAQDNFRFWLETNNIKSTDISGSADNLIHFYNGCDFHIGYRIHAHIYMSSISRPSILISEDGRGEALRDVISGLVFKGFFFAYKNKFISGYRRLGGRLDTFFPIPNIANIICHQIEYELVHGVRFPQPRRCINDLFPVMQSFLEQLP